MEKFICFEDHCISGFEGRYFIKQGTILDGFLKYGELRIPLHQLIGDAFPFSVVVDNPKYYESATRHIRNMKICEILNEEFYIYEYDKKI